MSGKGEERESRGELSEGGPEWLSKYINEKPQKPGHYPKWLEEKCPDGSGSKHRRPPSPHFKRIPRRSPPRSPPRRSREDLKRPRERVREELPWWDERDRRREEPPRLRRSREDDFPFDLEGPKLVESFDYQHGMGSHKRTMNEMEPPLKNPRINPDFMGDTDSHFGQSFRSRERPPRSRGRGGRPPSRGRGGRGGGPPQRSQPFDDCTFYEGEERELPNVEEKGKSLYCSFCDVTTTDIEQLQIHLLGAKHLKTLRKLGIEDEIGTLSEAAKEVNEAFGNTLVPPPQVKFLYCKVCRGTPFSDQLGPHIASAAHIDAEKNWKFRGRVLPSFKNMFSEEELGEEEIEPTGEPAPEETYKGALPLQCKLCNVYATSFEEFKKHLVGKRHQGMVRKSALEGAGVMGSTPVATIQPFQSYYCEICKVTCVNQQSLDIHFKSTEHACNVLVGGNTTGGVAPGTQYCDVCEKTYDKKEWSEHFTNGEHSMNFQKKTARGYPNTNPGTAPIPPTQINTNYQQQQPTPPAVPQVGPPAVPLVAPPAVPPVAPPAVPRVAPPVAPSVPPPTAQYPFQSWNQNQINQTQWNQMASTQQVQYPAPQQHAWNQTQSSQPQTQTTQYLQTQTASQIAQTQYPQTAQYPQAQTVQYPHTQTVQYAPQAQTASQYIQTQTAQYPQAQTVQYPQTGGQTPQYPQPQGMAQWSQQAPAGSVQYSVQQGSQYYAQWMQQQQQQQIAWAQKQAGYQAGTAWPQAPLPAKK
ncbi:PREDICTED: uncharacterized protein LOC105312099 [Amphimedon queenslandica]|uniref:C2H2-type domain-containing protein n=1 Tax=Amphimedon queenslandica TaxID=400682 RepID=A0A1X7V9L6_AMPQE|nr:PREDICTED: uncharacterized protein LOC105312099 [Amphimedon queenslandica]|eukprot:XP_011402777.1 PREDICTED: uncharacterized protein LOC105312099 [Amphimedon queenslandica]